MCDGRFHRAELRDQVARAFVADSRRAGNVIDRVPLQRQQIGHLRRLHAQEFLHLGRAVPFIVLGRVEHRDPVRHQLHHVLVAGYDHHLDARRFFAPCQSADHIVGLITAIFEHRDAHRFEQPPHVRDLLQQVGRRLRAVSLVLGKLLQAVGRFAAFEHGGNMRRLVLSRQLADHIVEDIDRLRGKPGGRPHGRSPAAGAGVVGAKDEAERVDEEKPLAWHLAHHTIGRRPIGWRRRSLPPVFLLRTKQRSRSQCP